VPVKGFEWFGGLGVQWTDSQVLDETLDPRSREPSFFWLDADIGISNPEQGWTITLAAQNLTDESVATIVEHIGLTSDTFVQSVRPPRQVFLGLHWEF
jgi:outer membrane receptor protein involved in Fe transport